MLASLDGPVVIAFGGMLVANFRGQVSLPSSSTTRIYVAPEVDYALAVALNASSVSRFDVLQAKFPDLESLEEYSSWWLFQVARVRAPGGSSQVLGSPSVQLIQGSSTSLGVGSLSLALPPATNLNPTPGKQTGLPCSHQDVLPTPEKEPILPRMFESPPTMSSSIKLVASELQVTSHSDEDPTPNSDDESIAQMQARIKRAHSETTISVRKSLFKSEYVTTNLAAFILCSLTMKSNMCFVSLKVNRLGEGVLLVLATGPLAKQRANDVLLRNRCPHNHFVRLCCRQSFEARVTDYVVLAAHFMTMCSGVVFAVFYF
ncbi:hypothetical protein LINGRAHAP2_LOCUS11645 [Linum grandiflorum]